MFKILLSIEKKKVLEDIVKLLTSNFSSALNALIMLFCFEFNLHIFLQEQLFFYAKNFVITETEFLFRTKKRFAIKQLKNVN